MRSYRELEEPTTTNYGPTQISGVHEAPTQPAPHVEEPFGGQLVGSIPVESLVAHFAPIVSLRSGQTFAFEALPRCMTPGLTEPEELFARAAFEKKVGELGRVVRGVAFEECVGVPVFLGVHPHELKESWLVRPDDPICSHDTQVYLQVDQPAYSAVCLHVLTELASRTGISLVLDDYGVGASTLKQMIDLSPAFVKLDAELVREIDMSPRKRTVVAALVNMCAELGAQVIAKGVDTNDEARALTEAGVQYAQGRLFGEPESLPMVSTWRGLR